MDEIVLLYNIKATKTGEINHDDRIVIGAHYDAISSSGTFFSAPGANDNASGTAGVMEIARVMSEYDFDLTVNHILFSPEAPNPTLMGGKYAAAKSVAENDNIVEMINLDMIGYYPYEVYDVQIHSPNANHRSGFISRSSTYLHIIVYEDFKWVSDEKSYGENGFPALLVSEYTYPTLHDYPWYHSRENKIDKLNIRFITEVLKFTLNGICLKAPPVIVK